MSILREAQEVAHGASRFGEWRNVGEEIWSGRERLFDAKNSEMAAYLARLHNQAVPVSNLLTRAIKEVKDLRKLLEITR